MELTAVLVVAAGVKIVVDWIRKGIPSLDGMLVNILALALGYAATYVPEVGDFATWVDRMTLAVAVSGTSHLFAEATTALRASAESNAVDGGVD